MCGGQGTVDDVDPSGDSVRLFLEKWLISYVEEEKYFESPLIYCEVKLQELLQLTEALPRPNSFRTWVCCDLLMKVR